MKDIQLRFEPLDVVQNTTTYLKADAGCFEDIFSDHVILSQPRIVTVIDSAPSHSLSVGALASHSSSSIFCVHSTLSIH